MAPWSLGGLAVGRQEAAPHGAWHSRAGPQTNALASSFLESTLSTLAFVLGRGQSEAGTTPYEAGAGGPSMPLWASIPCRF